MCETCVSPSASSCDMNCAPQCASYMNLNTVFVNDCREDWRRTDPELSDAFVSPICSEHSGRSQEESLGRPTRRSRARNHTANEAGGPWASVSGGTANRAIGEVFSVRGDFANRASGLDASVGGGQANEADSDTPSMSGARNNATVSQEVP